MRYNVTFSIPTKINSISTYKTRMKEIVFGQLKNLFNPLRFLSIFFWLFSIIIIPLMILYFVFCITEIIVDTILLPISLIPKIGVITFYISIIIWGFGVAVGRISGVELTYDIDEPIAPTLKENSQQVQNDDIENIKLRSYVATQIYEDTKNKQD